MTHPHPSSLDETSSHRHPPDTVFVKDVKFVATGIGVGVTVGVCIYVCCYSLLGVI